MISPFFDPTSNNGALDTQARYQANLYAVMADRHLLEARLRSMSGMEFMVVEQPPDGKEMENPIWVINKQDRQKRQGQEDEVTVLGTYYVVGENVWQAPSVENVLMTKLVC